MVGRRDQMQDLPIRSGKMLNATTPCAACKLLRRRCVQDCPFYPYFSRHEPHKFASVHKVFGARNVSKMLMEVPESWRAQTANSLIYEANVRLNDDPIYGCMGAIYTLQQQVQSLEAELIAVREEILKYKLREEVNNSLLISIKSHHLMSNNFISPSSPASAVVVATLTQGAQPPLQPSSPPVVVAAATSAAHLMHTASSSCLYNTQLITENSALGYSNSVNENVRYFD